MKLKQYILRVLQFITAPVCLQPAFFAFTCLLLYLPFLFRFTERNFLDSYSIGAIVFFAYFLSALTLPLRRFPVLKRTFQILISSLLILLNAVELFLFNNFYTGISAFTLQLLLQTNSGESGEFLSRYLLQFLGILSLVVLFAGGLVLLFRIRWVKESIRRYRQSPWVMLACLLCLLATVHKLHKKSYFDYLRQMVASSDSRTTNLLISRSPKDVLAVTLNSLKCVSSTRQETERIIRKVSEVRIDSCTFRSPTVVFIIGESFSKHHSDLYGYYLPTNPRLSVRKERGEMLVFNDVLTPFNDTSTSLKYMLSTARAVEGGDWLDGVLFPVVFRKAGYRVAWIDNQLVRTEGDSWDYLASYFLDLPEVSDASFDYRNEKRYRYDMELLAEYSELPPPFGERRA